MAHWPGTGILRNWFGANGPRGAAVPFEAPALRMARVCDDEREGLIAVLRDFAANGSVYVVPWSNLPLMVAMTDHDMALHHAVGESWAATPEQVRTVVSRLALSGALGEEAKAREGARTAANRSGLADAELILMLHLLNSCGGEPGALLAEPGQWRETEAKAALAAVAAATGVRRRDIYPRIAELAHLLVPVGLVAGDRTIQSGWLRVLHNEIAGFSQNQMPAAKSERPDAAQHLQVIADLARRATELSGCVLNIIDYAVLDIVGTIRRWRREQPILRQAIERLSVTLDEWPAFMKLVHDALRFPPEKMIVELVLLRSVLPYVPQASGEAIQDPASPSASVVLAGRLSHLWSLLPASRTG